MTYRPMLFNTPMVCAIECGDKTETRRLINVHDDNLEILDVKPHPDLHGTRIWEARVYGSKEDEFTMNIKAPCAKDDVIWVRETWKRAMKETRYGLHDCILYKADEPDESPYDVVEGIWHPSIHMPKEAARIFLHVDDVRAERLKSMSAMSAMDEGFTDWNAFVSLWNSTVPRGKLHKFGWNANPWVWVVKFTRTERPEGWPLNA